MDRAEQIADQVRELMASGQNLVAWETVNEALTQFPGSASLWDLCGDIIQLSEIPDVELMDALRCYEHAIEAEPENSVGYVSKAYFLDAFLDDFEHAKVLFEKAIELGAGSDAYVGLARVLAQLGDEDRALEWLSPSWCPFHEDENVADMRREVEEGTWSLEKPPGGG